MPSLEGQTGAPPAQPSPWHSQACRQAPVAPMAFGPTRLLFFMRHFSYPRGRFRRPSRPHPRMHLQAAFYQCAAFWESALSEMERAAFHSKWSVRLFLSGLQLPGPGSRPGPPGWGVGASPGPTYPVLSYSILWGRALFVNSLPICQLVANLSTRCESVNSLPICQLVANLSTRPNSFLDPAQASYALNGMRPCPKLYFVIL